MKILILVNNSVKVSSDNSYISEIEKVYRHHDIHSHSRIPTFETVRSSDSRSCFSNQFIFKYRRYFNWSSCLWCGTDGGMADY